MKAGDQALDGGRQIMGCMDRWWAVGFMGLSCCLKRDPDELLLLLMIRLASLCEVDRIHGIQRGVQEDHVGGSCCVGVANVAGVHEVEGLQAIRLDLRGSMEVRRHRNSPKKRSR